MDSAEDVKRFMAITGSEESQASFFIDSAKGDLHAAITMYYESENAGATDSATNAGTTMPGEYKEHEELGPVQTSTSANSTKSKGKSAASRGGINTLGSLRDDDDEDDDDKPAEFYTGGEKSGLGVIDPTKKKDGPAKATNVIQEILRKAAAGGRESTEPASQTSSFRGSGYTLGGDEEEESRVVEDPNEAFRRAMSAQPPKVTRVLKLWQDGFSVDDGRLYRYDDPANKGYLEAINKGHAPLALLNVAIGQPVDVNVEKKTDEQYTPPPKVYKPFEGSGHRLGSELPPQTTSSSSSSSTTAAASTSTAAAPTMTIDEAQPSTSLQIRLAAGGRLVSQFNTSHTVADVYDFVERSSPSDGRSYVLLTPFPRKEFAKDGTTLEQAGLLKGVLQQKFQ